MVSQVVSERKPFFVEDDLIHKRFVTAVCKIFKNGLCLESLKKEVRKNRKLSSRLNQSSFKFKGRNRHAIGSYQLILPRVKTRKHEGRFGRYFCIKSRSRSRLRCCFQEMLFAENSQQRSCFLISRGSWQFTLSSGTTKNSSKALLIQCT